MDDLTREILHFIDRYRAKAAKAGGLTDSNHMLLHAIALDPRGLALPVPKNDFCQPPMVLEEKTGLRGLGVDWKMPAGLRPVELQIYGMLLAHAMECGDLSRAQGQGRMFEACMALAVRNPPLQALRLDGKDTRKLYDVMLGVASGFNVDDMQHYLDGKVFYISQRDPEWQSRNTQLGGLLQGHHIGWVMSIATMDAALAQLAAPAAKPALRNRFTP